MTELLNQLGISGIGAVACLVAAFLFKILAKQVKESTVECQKDRDDLRGKIDTLNAKQIELEKKTVKAEVIASLPCHLTECPKRDSNLGK